MARYILIPAMLAFGASLPASAAKFYNFPCGMQAAITNVTVISDAPADVTAQLTDSAGNPRPFPGTGFDPSLVQHTALDPVSHKNFTNFSVINNNFKPVPDACDLKATFTFDTGPVSDLSFESLFHDPATGRFLISDAFADLAQIRGVGVSTTLPVLIADTNKDGTVGPGDVLYSLVDVEPFLQSPSPPSLGQVISITNGVATGITGMTFSTTPFVYDPDKGFSGTPFTGSSQVLAINQTSAVPEPETYALLMAGLGLVSWRRRRMLGGRHA